MALQQNQPKSLNLPARFLVASPHVGRSPFDRSVVLLFRSDPRSASGILLDAQFRQSFQQVQQRLDSRDMLPADRFSAEMRLSVINWKTDQLLNELQQGIWLTTPALREDLTRGDDLWLELVQRVGRSVLTNGLGIDQFPNDPRLN